MVTGTHRSGSTWVGRMLALSGKLGYVHEPFNRNSGISGELFENWFTYICEENEERYQKRIENYISFKYPLMRKLTASRSVRDIGRSFRDFSKFSWNRLLNKRALVKDPISIFSAEWLYENFDMDVIVLIRHPAAFAGSIKKAGWRSGMKNFLRQPLLMEHLLVDFKDEIHKHNNNELDYVDEAILLWNMIHSVILNYQKKYKNEWLFGRHEDISMDPVRYFFEMYKYLDLDFKDSIRNKIEEFSSNSDNAHKLKRDSKANIYSWKNRLTAEEIDRVRRKTEKISSEFYSDDDWQTNN